MGTTKISITVDTKRLEELKRLAGAGVSLSAVVDEALRLELHRYRMTALLDEMERTQPLTDEDRAAGEQLWQQIKSSWTQARSRPSPRKKAPSASPSRKR
jgi:hypothetical protein